MTTVPQKKPLTRETREAAALRENLRKRKLQAQNREAKPEDKEDE
jgi:hypothetical protein